MVQADACPPCCCLQGRSVSKLTGAGKHGPSPTGARELASCSRICCHAEPCRQKAIDMENVVV